MLGWMKQSWNQDCQHARMLSRFSRVWLCVILWTAAHQAPPSTGFSRQKYWSGLPLPSPHLKLTHYKSKVVHYKIKIVKIRVVNPFHHLLKEVQPPPLPALTFHNLLQWLYFSHVIVYQDISLNIDSFPLCEGILLPYVKQITWPW